MAFYRCGGGDSGGSWTETTLWTNSSPSSDFVAQTITLNESRTKYDFIGITFKTISSSSLTCTVYIKPSTTFRVGLSANSNNYVRNIILSSSSNTSVSCETAKKVGGSGTSDSYSIPTKIIGVKL